MSRKLQYDLGGLSRLIEAVGLGQILSTVAYSLNLGSGLIGRSQLPGDAVMVIVYVWILTVFVGFFLLVVWVYRAATNAALIMPDERWIRPWWTVIWWFVPIINLWQPIRSMSQIWNASVDHDIDLNGPAAPAVTTWWLLQLFAPALASLLAGDRQNEEYVLGASMLFMAGSTAALFAILKSVPNGQISKANAETGVRQGPSVGSMVAPSTK